MQHRQQDPLRCCGGECPSKRHLMLQRAMDGHSCKLQPGGWPAYTCNNPPSPADGRDRQWLIASHSGGSAPPEKPASSFSWRATTVGEVKPERQSNRANTKSVAPQHRYAVGFLPPVVYSCMMGIPSLPQQSFHFQAPGVPGWFKAFAGLHIARPRIPELSA